MKEKKDNSDILFNSPTSNRPMRNRPRGNPYPPNPRGPAPRGPVPRGPAPRKKFIDDNLFSDPNLNKPKKERKPLPPNFGVMVIAVIIALLAIGGLIYYFVTREKTEKPEEPTTHNNKNIFVGTWNCKDYLTDDGNKYYQGDKFIISISFDNDGRFLFGSYSDLENNYTVGTYQLELVEKKNADLQIYNLGLFATKAVKNSYIEKGNFQSIYKSAISVNSGSMILDNQNKDSLYYCISHDRTNPKIEK